MRKRGHMSSIYILSKKLISVNNDRSHSRLEPHQTSLRQISYSEGLKNVSDPEDNTSIQKNISSHQMTINSKFILRYAKPKK